MKKQLSISLLGILSILIFNSCATIFSPKTYPLNISTAPTSAEVRITTKKGEKVVYNGASPTSVMVKPSYVPFVPAKYNVNISKSGYEDINFDIKSNINGWYFGNLVLGGVLGMVVIDPISGAMYKIPEKKGTVFKELKPNGENGYDVQFAVTNDDFNNNNDFNSFSTNFESGGKIAIFNPTGNVNDGVKTVVREELSSIVVGSKKYTVLERALIDKVLEESKFQMSGQVDDSQVGELGKKMGADYVCIASITPMGNNFYVSIKLVSVTTARVEKQKTGMTQNGGSDILKVVGGLARNIMN